MQSPPIICTAGTKGGTGKSTVSMGLGAELLARGHRTLIIDGDEQQRTVGKWSDVAAEQSRAVPQIVCVGPALAAQLRGLAQGYDVVLVDMPCRLEKRTEHVARHCDLVLVPCGPTAPELWELATTLQQIFDVQTEHPHVKASIVINSKPARTVMAREARRIITTDPLVLQYGFPVMRSELHRAAPHGYAWAAGQGVTVYDPHSTAAREMRALADEVSRLLGLRRPRRQPPRKARVRR